MIGSKLTAGIITGAEQADWQRRLEVPAQFVNELAALNKLAPKVKTTTVTVTHGGKERQVDVTDTQSRTEFINEVSLAIATEHKLNPVLDARKIQALVHQRHPALFKDIPHVEIKMPGGKK